MDPLKLHSFLSEVCGLKDSVEVENLQDQSLSMLQHHINSGSKINGKLYLSSISIIAKVELLIFFCGGFFLIQKYLFFIISTIKEQNYYFSENYEWRGSNFIETIISGTWWWFKWICGVFDLSTAGSKLIYRFKIDLPIQNWFTDSKNSWNFESVVLRNWVFSTNSNLCNQSWKL